MDSPTDQLVHLFASLHAYYQQNDATHARPVCQLLTRQATDAKGRSPSQRLIHANPITEYIKKAMELLLVCESVEVFEQRLIGLEQEYMQRYGSVLQFIRQNMVQIVEETSDSNPSEQNHLPQ